MATGSQTASPGTGESDKASPVSGISQFLGRVLEQLSLSSWMPAAMLVGNLTVLLQLYSAGNLDVGAAFDVLTSEPLGVLIVFLLAVVLASIIVQAFEFEAIRLGEGYLNQRRGPWVRIAKGRIRRHVDKRQSLEDTYATLEKEQFARARTQALSAPTPLDRATLDALERDVFGDPQPENLDPAWLQDVRQIDWTQYLAADDLYVSEAIDSKLARYPAKHRVLPTRLGNALRAAEDVLTLADAENLEGYVLRHHDQLPDVLRNEHHDYRVRLEMYAGLFLVFASLSVLSAGLLGGIALWWQTVLVSAAYLALTWISYEACVASALGYGDVLREIDWTVLTAHSKQHDPYPLAAADGPTGTSPDVEANGSGAEENV